MLQESGRQTRFVRVLSAMYYGLKVHDPRSFFRFVEYLNFEFVQVHFGNSTIDIGSLDLDASQSVFTLTTIIIVAVIAIISLAIILIICIAYRKKSKESERVVRLFTNQMNTLEARVATECKEGKCRRIISILNEFSIF